MQLILSKNLGLADQWREQYLHVDIFLIYILFIAGSIRPPLMLNNHQLLQILLFFYQGFLWGTLTDSSNFILICYFTPAVLP